MRTKLIHKLLAVNIGIILIFTVSLVSLSLYFSDGMFSNALNGIDREVLKTLTPKLAEHYQKNNSWDELTQNPSSWEDIINNNFYAVFFQLMEKSGHNPAATFGKLKQTDEGLMPTNTKPWQVPFGTFLQRAALLAPDKSVLVPPQMQTEETIKRAIRLDGELVGWLQVGKIKVDFIPLAQYFFEQQTRIVYWSTILGGIIAAIFSIVLSRHLTSPIKRLIEGSRSLADRKFETRIKVDTNDELEELADSFNRMADDLAQYQIRQRQWLTHISHELKTPLTVLVGEIYAICDNLSSCNEATAAFLQEEVNHVKRLADDLFEASKMEETGFQLQWTKIDLQEILDRQIRYYQNRFSNNQLTVIRHVPEHSIWLMGDADRLAQVFINLFENCIRYVNKPGQLDITVTCDKDSVYVQLLDSGPGVSDPALKKLFDRFYSEDSGKHRSPRGAGLGLSISRDIVVAHRGTIAASTGENGGLAINITLPLIRPWKDTL